MFWRNRVASMASTWDASVTCKLPPRTSSRSGTRPARATASAPTLAHPASTHQRARTSVRAHVVLRAGLLASGVAAEAAARHLPLKRQSAARSRVNAEPRVHSRTSHDATLPIASITSMLPSPALHLAALALCATEVVVRAVRLRLLVPGAPHLSLWQAVTINAYGDAASAVTPGRLGGDPARFLGCRRAGLETPRALAGLAVEALIDWVLLAVATVILGLAFADTGAAGARHLVTLATGPKARLLVALVLALAIASAGAARWYRRRMPAGALGSLAGAWQRARRLGWPSVTLAAALTALSMALRIAILPVLVAGQPGFAAALTALSMALRIAILPVLVAGQPGFAAGAVVLGSFTLLFGQLVLPTPAGAGAVELGFVGGFAGTMSTAALATLLVAWRVYTLILPAGLGALLLAGALGGGRRATTSSYSASSSANVRSQP